MREPSRQLAQGCIVWASISDPRGRLKKRPLVIVTETSEIVLDNPIVAVAVTTTFPEPPTRQYVELPWDRRGHPATKLARRSAAVCNWLVELTTSQVEEIKGFIPTRTLIEIINRVRELSNSPQI